MTPELNITIAGTSNTGKSAIAELIRQQLELHGITATLNDDNGIGLVEEAPGVVAQTLHQRLESIGQRTSVTIRTSAKLRSSNAE